METCHSIGVPMTAMGYLLLQGAWTGIVQIDRSAEFSGNVAHSDKNANILDLRPCGLCSTVKFDTTVWHASAVDYFGNVSCPASRGSCHSEQAQLPRTLIAMPMRHRA